ncbi:MAG: hypothetical protein HRF49_01565 [bacterium]
MNASNDISALSAVLKSGEELHIFAPAREGGTGMFMPFGEIQGRVLTMSFSSADFSVASVLTALREHLDLLNEMKIEFAGVATDVGSGDPRVFKPVMINASFEYTGEGDGRAELERAYHIIWKGVVFTFPDEEDWATAKESYSAYISSQADLLRARTETIHSARED